MKKQPFERTLKMFFGAILFTAGAFVARADAPGFIAYQGKLTANDGTPVADSSYPVIFSILESNGNPIYTAPLISVATVNGVFSALIPVPAFYLQGGTDRFLQMTYNGSAFSPQQLVSAPFALAVATGSVGTAEIQDGTVTDPKIVSVAADKILSGALPDTVIASSVAVSAVGAAQINTGGLLRLYVDSQNNVTINTRDDFIGYYIPR